MCCGNEIGPPGPYRANGWPMHATDRYPPEYNKLRRLPWWQRRQAKAWLDRGEGIYGSVLVPVRAVRPEPKDPAPDEGGAFVPEPIQEIDKAFFLLNLSRPGCNLKRAKKAYRKAALKTHPDMGGTPEKFRATRLAYDLVVEFLS